MHATLSYICDRKQRIETDVALHRRIPLQGVWSGVFLVGGESVSRELRDGGAAGIIHVPVGYRLLNLQGSRSAGEVAVADAEVVVEATEPAAEHRLRVEGISQTKARCNVSKVPGSILVAPSREKGVV